MMKTPLLSALLILVLLQACSVLRSPVREKAPLSVIAYYAGPGTDLHEYKWAQLTHVIYSFCHLRGNELAVDDANDSLIIRKLVALKQQYPHLKVQLSLGGWGGCKMCSEVFSTEKGRADFAASVARLLIEYRADGIDLDWEYPAIEGYPEHPYMPDDRRNFTLLVQALRRVLGQRYEISFAAGGFATYFDRSIEWGAVMPLLDRVNLMSYDLVSGYSTVTGHHTPLYSSPGQEVSADFGVRYLVKLGVPKQKIVIGAAFYARTWEQVADINHGLYQSGKFKQFVPYDAFEKTISAEKGFVFYRDSIAGAPYAYSAEQKLFATFDDAVSVALKTRYARDQGLGGIMFWQLRGDKPEKGLLQAISNENRPKQ